MTIEDRKFRKSIVLTCDSRGGLFYYIIKDYLLVHWENSTRFSVDCYDDSVVQTNLSLPRRVEQIFVTTESNVWLLLGLPHKDGNHCVHLPRSKLQHLEDVLN